MAKKSQQEDAVVSEAAQELVKRIFDRDYYSDSLIQNLAEQTAQKFTPNLLKKIDEKIEEVIERHFEGLLYKTNNWGEKTGEKIGMTDLILDRIEKWLSVKVDRDGSVSNSSYGDKWTRAQWLVGTYATKDLQKRIDEKIAQIRDAALSEVTSTVSEILTKKIAAKGGV